MSNLTPRTQAFKDFKGGGGQSDNPYPNGSEEHYSYMWEMTRLWDNELKDIRRELAVAI
jgi:hypothetical protein